MFAVAAVLKVCGRVEDEGGEFYRPHSNGSVVHQRWALKSGIGCFFSLLGDAHYRALLRSVMSFISVVFDNRVDVFTEWHGLGLG